MPVKRRKPKVRITGFPDWQVRFLETGQEPEHALDINEFEVLTWKCHRASKDDPARVAWSKIGGRILKDWIKRHPGTRCYAWWEYTGPRVPIGTWPGCFWDGKLSAPRLRVGGVGTPGHEVLAYVPSFFMGIPKTWVEPMHVRWYKDKDFQGVAVDPDDPPVFESQAAYLDRHKLLSADEREALPDDAFAPVAYVPE